MKDIAYPLFGTIEGMGVPRWAVMWAVAIGMFALAKLLTVWEVRRQGRRMRVGRTAAYVLLWVGMDPNRFTEGGRVEQTVQKAAPGLVKMFLGGFLLWGVAPMLKEIAAGWVGMVGLVLMLHFGLFHLLAIFWLRRGMAVEAIMNRPLLARTLGEFWGKRWNRAFSELMHRFVFRPALRRCRVEGATVIAFFVSGLIHDVVISGPAGDGYGLPTTYFLVQAAGLLAQRTRVARRWGLTDGVKGRMFTGAVLLAPLPLLFHEPFIDRVILPFMEVIGAGAIGG